MQEVEVTPKLTEPQKQILRMMRQYNCSVVRKLPVAPAQYVIPKYVGKYLSPRRHDLWLLERYSFLRADASNWRQVTFRLTPKGRELAEELQGDQTN